MSILLHVIFASVSLIVTGVTAFAPTQRRMVASYLSIAATLGSGALLAVLDHSTISHVCTSGLIYLGFESLGLVVSVRRLRLAEVTV